MFLCSFTTYLGSIGRFCTGVNLGQAMLQNYPRFLCEHKTNWTKTEGKHLETRQTETRVCAKATYNYRDSAHCNYDILHTLPTYKN